MGMHLVPCSTAFCKERFYRISWKSGKLFTYWYEVTDRGTDAWTNETTNQSKNESGLSIRVSIFYLVKNIWSQYVGAYWDVIAAGTGVRPVRDAQILCWQYVYYSNVKPNKWSDH
jgi:hypothetical protein